MGVIHIAIQKAVSGFDPTPKDILKILLATLITVIILFTIGYCIDVCIEYYNHSVSYL